MLPVQFVDRLAHLRDGDHAATVAEGEEEGVGIGDHRDILSLDEESDEERPRFRDRNLTWGSMEFKAAPLGIVVSRAFCKSVPVDQSL